MYVHSKHADNFFDSKQVPRELPLTVWLTHDGIKCVQATVTYAELADMLGMLARVAALMAMPPVPQTGPPGAPSPSAA